MARGCGIGVRVIVLLSLIGLVSSEHFHICDCNNTVNRGLIDLEDPSYCSENVKGKVTMFNATYALYTKKKPPISFTGYLCEMWEKTKEITGSFWIGDYDTVYSQRVLKVDSDTCWRMVKKQKCGPTDNDMIRDDKIITFITEPTGEGAWYSTKTYSVVNCFVREITLTLESPDGQVIAPFGKIKETLDEEKASINDNIIVWKKTVELKNYKKSCQPTQLLKSTGRTYTTGAKGRLLDDDKELEFIYSTSFTPVCGLGSLHEVIGIPDTFVNIAKTSNRNINFPHINTAADNIRNKRSIGETKILAGGYPVIGGQAKEAWGRLYLKGNTNKVVTSVEAGQKLTLENKTNYTTETLEKFHSDPGMYSYRNQEFLFSRIDGRIRSGDPKLCLITKGLNYVTVEPCTVKANRWTMMVGRNYIIDLKTMGCLTASNNNLILSKCTSTDSNQMWQFEIYNTTKEIGDVVTLTEQKTFEQRFLITHDTLKMNNQSLEEGYLVAKHIWSGYEQTRACGTIQGEKLTPAPCKFITDRHKIVYFDQFFEYDSDYTLRKSGSNLCLSNTTEKQENFLSFQLCTNKSNRWFFESKSDQLITISPFSQKGKILCLGTVEDQILLVDCTKTPRAQWVMYNVTGSVNRYTSPINSMEGVENLLKDLQAGKDHKLILNDKEKEYLDLYKKINVGVRERYIRRIEDFRKIRNIASSSDAGTDQGMINPTVNPVDIISTTGATTPKPPVKITTKSVPKPTEKPISPHKNQTEQNSSYTYDFIERWNSVPSYKLQILELFKPTHEQYKVEIETEHENKLASEIRQVYCQFIKLKRNQALLIAQSDGLLAGQALDMPKCTRIQSIGSSLLLQQCELKNVSIQAEESKCGFQPLVEYNNRKYTLGVNGWSLHNYQPCFHSSSIININGVPSRWVIKDNIGHWEKEPTAFHLKNLNLIKEFDTLIINDYNYAIKDNYAFNKHDLEPINVLKDLIGHIQIGSSNTVGNVIQTERQEAHKIAAFSWLHYIKIILFSFIGIFFTVIGLFLGMKPCIKAIEYMRYLSHINPSNAFNSNVTKQKNEEPKLKSILKTTDISNPIEIEQSGINTFQLEESKEHCHTKITFKPEGGMMYEDGCEIIE